MLGFSMMLISCMSRWICGVAFSIQSDAERSPDSTARWAACHVLTMLSWSFLTAASAILSPLHARSSEQLVQSANLMQGPAPQLRRQIP
ncbi:hypothetical protein D3C80_1973460 [compost metagenome]